MAGQPNAAIFKTSVGIGAKLGIQIKPLGWDECLFTGTAINTTHAPTAGDVLHEIGHFVVAAPEVRRQRNFGWYDCPAGPDAEENSQPGRDGYRKAKPRVTYFGAGLRFHTTFLGEDRAPVDVTEENVASVLGILAQRAFDDPDWKWTVKDHNWDWPSFWAISRYLHRIQLVSKELVPEFLHGRLTW